MTAFGIRSLAAAGSEGVDKVNENVEQEASDVIEGIEDFVGLARGNQKQKRRH